MDWGREGEIFSDRPYLSSVPKTSYCVTILYLNVYSRILLVCVSLLLSGMSVTQFTIDGHIAILSLCNARVVTLPMFSPSLETT